MVKKLNLLLLILVFFINIGCWLILPEFKTLNYALVGAFVCLVGINLVLNKDFIKQRLSFSLQKRLLSEFTTIFLVTCILALAAYLVDSLNWQKDITDERANTLSRKTVKIIEQINEPLVIEFYTRREYWKNWKPFFNLFQIENNLIDYKFINIESNQSLVSANNITKENTAIFKYQGKEIKAVLTDELSVSNVFLKMIGFKKETFYFLTGHGELSTQNTGPNGLSYLKELLQKEGHEVQNLNLSQQASFDKNGVIIIANIANPLLDSEREILQKFIKNQGRYIILQGVSFKERGYESLNLLLAPLKVQIENKMTIDRLAVVKGEDASLPVIENFPFKHIILQNFKERLFFPLSSSLKISDGFSGAQLIQTDLFPASWAESELQDVLAGKAKFDNQDTPGPILLATTIENKMSRGVLFASHYFLTNQYKNHSPQFNFFLNNVDWIVGQEQMASLDRPTLKLSRIHLDDLHLNIVFYGSVIVGPLIFLMISSLFFFRRKSL